MPNILQMQEILKTVPDQRLMQEMQQPTGRAPTFLVMTELQRRKKVRDEYQGRVEEEQTTVVEDMVRGAPPQQPPAPPGGMASLAPPPPMQSQAPMQPPGPPQQAGPPIRAESGGALYRQAGSSGGIQLSSDDIVRLGKLVEGEAGNQGDEGRRAVVAVVMNRVRSPHFPNTIKEVIEQKGQFNAVDDRGGGKVDEMPVASSGTRNAVLQLLASPQDQNPVGDALYYQNPEISDLIFPSVGKNYDGTRKNFTRNNEPFDPDVKKVGDHVFTTRYRTTDPQPRLEPAVYTVQASALTEADRGRLISSVGTETMMNFVAGEEVVPEEDQTQIARAPSEPPPVVPSSTEGAEKEWERRYKEGAAALARGQDEVRRADQLAALGLADDVGLKSGVAERLRPSRPPIPVGEPITEGLGSVRRQVTANIPPIVESPVEAAAIPAEAVPVPSPIARDRRDLLRAGREAVDTTQPISKGVLPQLAGVRGGDFVPSESTPQTEQSWLNQMLALLPDFSPGERSEVAKRLTVPPEKIPIGEKITPQSPLAQVREGMKYYEDPLRAFGGPGDVPPIPTDEVKRRLAELQAPLKEAYEKKGPFITTGPYEVVEPVIERIKEVAEASKGQITPARTSADQVRSPDYSLDVAGYDPAAQAPVDVPLSYDPFVYAEERARLAENPPDMTQFTQADIATGANIPSAEAFKAAYDAQQRTQPGFNVPASGRVVSSEDPALDMDGPSVSGGPPPRPAPGAGGLPPPTGGAGGIQELMAQIAAGRDDAKAMGLLTAGLGIMQQASQPGATLLSSIPGAAAGVKQYSADKANLAKQQMALATLANQQEATRIAAQRAAKPDAYERYERDVLDDWKNSPNWEKYFFDDGTGKPGRVKPTVRSEIRKTYARTLDPSLTASRVEQTYVKYEGSKAGKARLSQIRKALIDKHGMDEATAFREAPLILRREFLSGGSAQSAGTPTKSLSSIIPKTG